MDEYDAIAEWFAGVRSPIVGLPEMETLARALPRRARVLDAGCGTGVPLLQYLLQRGFELFAIDSSRRMVELFRERFPHVPVECASILDSGLFASTFDAVVAWSVLFHLSPDDQRAAIAKLAGQLEPGGWFVFTAGRDEGETSGVMQGVAFRYVSLGSPEYRRVLEENGMELVGEHEDAWENYVYVTRKRMTQASGRRVRRSRRRRARSPRRKRPALAGRPSFTSSRTATRRGSAIPGPARRLPCSPTPSRTPPC